jgi:type I restriction enzyme S subunit
MKLPVPSFDEQRRIADFLDREVSKNSALIAKTEGAISKLLEYRSTLISAAVTGQIDVRNYRAQGVLSCP